MAGVWSSGKSGVANATEFAHAKIWPIFLVVYAAALCLCALDLIDGQAFLGDIDDLMREIQIRQLMSPAGDWWDLNLPMIATPDAYFSPWSRLVDLPYVVITKLLSPLLSERAISASFLIWPPLLLGVYSFLAASVVARTIAVRSLRDGMVVVAATILMLFSVWEFVPGRIDHHNMQLVALMAIVAGLARFDRAGGVMVGLGSLMSVAIALEGLPFIVVAFFALVVAFLLNIRGAAQVLRAAALFMLIATVPVALMLLGRSGSLSTQCDAFSAPYIFLLLGCSGSLLLAATVFRKASAVIKVISLGVPAGGVLAAAVLLFPRCLAGPYWMIDPVSKHYWFDRIPQEQGLLYLMTNGQFSLVLIMALLGVVLIAAAPSVLSALRRGEPGLTMVFVVSVASLVLTIALIRYIRFPSAFIPLLTAFAHRRLIAGSDAVGRSRWLAQGPIFVGIGLLFAVMLVIRLLVPPVVKHYDAVDYMAYDDCKAGDFSALASLPPGHILAPQALSLTLATGMPSGFSVAAVPFHRASPGMRLVFEAFVSTDAETRRQALAPFDYVAVCRFPLKAEMGEAPLYDALSAGGEWPGLIRVPNDPSNPFQLFRIDHANLQ
jgi:hypothetical protein